jgi:predicted dehydrogenase
MPRTRKTATPGARPSGGPKRIRYAVVGLGYISQVAVLPAFRHARENSELVALVSGDPAKLDRLGRRHRVPYVYDYSGYAKCLENEEVDAVYIALPNHMHRDCAVAAAEAGKHVLCEKPLAVTEQECEEMILATDRARVKLMTAYRLHFDESNLKAVELVRSAKQGEPRVFQSAFTRQVEKANIRLGPTEKGGGPIYDIGIYCINAARYLFRAEPLEAFAWSASGGDERFAKAPEMMSCLLRFPSERLASFTCSFGAADTGWYQIVGTKGDLRADPAYEYAERAKHRVTIGGKSRETAFAKRDQFAPELLYFSRCILEGTKPEPSGREGLADVRIIRSLLESARTGRTVKLEAFERARRPTMKLEIRRPPVSKPPLVHAESPSGN